MSTIQRQEVLQAAYHDVIRRGGLIDFILQVRTQDNNFAGKYSVKQAQLSNLFSNSVWVEQKKKGGHRKIINRVTHVVIEYADHKNKIDPGAVQSICEAVQGHVNILGNDIFKYGQGNFKKEPNYTEAINRWNKHLS